MPSDLQIALETIRDRITYLGQRRPPGPHTDGFIEGLEIAAAIVEGVEREQPRRLHVQPIEELFHFIHFKDWMQTAQMRFRNHGHTNESTICVDEAGMVCTRGKYFKQAKYPVRVYAVDDPPYQPSGMTGGRGPISQEAADIQRTGQDMYAAPMDLTLQKHRFTAVKDNAFCGQCGGGPLHAIHVRREHAR